jgi:GrpB-like predicted nucleotidyltransferase (UPF0157 family)
MPPPIKVELAPHSIEWGAKAGEESKRIATVLGSNQLHCFQIRDTEIERHLAFRDYLRAHPDVAIAYDGEKRRCRDLYPDNSHLYTDAKAAWIDSVLPLALEYYRQAKQS